MIEFDVLPEHLDGSGRLLLGARLRATCRGERRRLSTRASPTSPARDYAGVELDVDLKLPGYEERAIAALRAHGLAERSLISTMEPSSLKLIREIAPDIRLGRSFPSVRDDPMKHPLKRWPAYALIAYWRAAPAAA